MNRTHRFQNIAAAGGGRDGRRLRPEKVRDERRPHSRWDAGADRRPPVGQGRYQRRAGRLQDQGRIESLRESAK